MTTNKDGRPKWWKNIILQNIALGAAVFVIATLIAISYLTITKSWTDPIPFDEEIIIPKG